MYSHVIDMYYGERVCTCDVNDWHYELDVCIRIERLLDTAYSKVMIKNTCIGNFFGFFRG